jgi:predicted amidophosphoribosyltransferase
MLMTYESPVPFRLKARDVQSFEVNLCERCGGIMPVHRKLAHCASCVSRDPIDGFEIHSVRHWTLYVTGPPAGDAFLFNREVLDVSAADPEAVEEYADHMHWMVKGDNLPLGSACVVPVPVRDSGFNMSGVERLADATAARLSIPYVRGLERSAGPAGYRGMDARERKRVMPGTMRARQRFDAKDVLLVDDLMVSGYTLKEAARALRAVGANRVYGLVCGRAIAYDELCEHIVLD